MGYEKQRAIERENEDREGPMNFIQEHPYPDFDFVSKNLLLKWRSKPRPYEINL